MVLPIVAGLLLLTAGCTGRAAFRAWRRVRAVPNSVFADALRAGTGDRGGGAGGGAAAHAPRPPFLPGGFQDRMTYGEAIAILGVAPGASRAAITAQHRRIMLANHPDRGGSNYFASKINEAKDVALQHAKP